MRVTFTVVLHVVSLRAIQREILWETQLIAFLAHGVGVTALTCCALAGVVSSAPTRTPSATPSPSPPPPPEEHTCNFEFYMEVYNYEVANGLFQAHQNCVASIDDTQRQPFGPPSEFEIFKAVCKTQCRGYTDRIMRIESATDCDCSKFSLAGSPACPKTATDILCKVIGICHDSVQYQLTYCGDTVCGRQVDNTLGEDSWRKCFGFA